jgi:two-component system CheB/CheR fusion protein
LLICRNAIMYFNTETQAKILARFHFALNNNGFLFLGKAEMLFSRNHSYTSVDLRQRVFTKVGNRSMRDLLLNTAHSKSQGTIPEMVDKLGIYETSFEVDLLAQIVVDRNGIVILANAEARNLFNLNLKDIDRPFQDLELSYRPVDLRSPIDQVRSNRRAISLKDVEWSIAQSASRYFDVQITPLLDENIDELLGIKITFTDVTRFKQLQQDLVNANQELETAYEELQSTNEELETTNEELQSTVEELETTNEELQSTNEELETMNEELQSTNEELQTMNEELRQRSGELNQVNTFLESILTSLRAGVVVLSRDLQILIWNRKAEDMWGLRFDEVFSKQLISLDIGLPIEPLIQPLRAIITGESENHEVVLNAINRRGRAIECELICTPLQSSGSHIQGVILVMEQQQQQ